MNSNDIFMKHTKPLYQDINNVININFSESEAVQRGGDGSAYSDNVINIAFSASEKLPAKHGQQGGSNTETSEYFNKLASKIVNNVSRSQNGGFNVKTSPENPTESDFFLSSETINNINSNTLSGGAASKKTFNFESLKRHIKRAVELDGGSEEKHKKSHKKDDLDDDDDEDDEDDDSDDDLFEDGSDDEDDEEDEDEEDKRVTVLPTISDKIHVKVGKRQTKHNKSHSASNSESHSGSESLSLNMDDSTEQFRLSDSAATPELMSYRSVDKKKVMSGSRFT